VKMTKGLVGLGAVLALSLSLPAAGLGALAGVQDDRLAVTPLKDINARLNLIAKSGAKVTRVDLFWSEVAPTKPRNPDNPKDRAYKWQHEDAIFTGLAKRKIIPIVTVFNTPAWAAGGKTGPVGGYNPNMPNAAQYGRFMGAVAKRYSGTYKVGGRTLPQVRFFEVWNEPNLQLYMYPQWKGSKAVSIVNYAKLVRAAYPRVKKANPNAVVIAGVAGPKGKSNLTGVGSIPWLNGFLRQRAPFDAYSQHIYPAAGPRSKTKAKPSWNTIPLILKTLDRVKKDIPLYITEAGYTTLETPYRKVKVTLRQQSTFLGHIFGLPQVKQKRVPVVVWFNLQDNPNWPGGLIALSGHPKLALLSFRKVARGGLIPAELQLPTAKPGKPGKAAKPVAKRG
jgi:polysaccharide biosynthesis protein PslG